MKICGVTRREDARLAADLGARRIGLVFWPGSPRFVRLDTAAAIVGALPGDVEAVGVFVDQAPGEVERIVRETGLAAAQLHGNEDVAQYRGVGAPLIKSVAVSDSFDTTVVDAVPADVAVLLDAHDPVKRGGTGRTIDWQVAAAIARRRPVILSGGLTPDNVAEAIAAVAPHMIDVSSGVESSPGVKDPAKLRELFARIA